MLAKLVASLGGEACSASELAEHIGFDAHLALAVLRHVREAGGHEQLAATPPLAKAVEFLGVEFVRALALHARPLAAEQQAAWENSIRVACLAQQLAAYTRVCDEHQAWLAGLAHNLVEYPGFAQPDPLDEWLLAADASGFVADAVRFCRASPARVKSAHPLVRVLQLAVSLVYSEHANGNVGIRASLGGLGLDAAEAERLQAEAEYLAQEAVHRYAGPANVSADGLAQAYAALARTAALKDCLDPAADLESLSGQAALVMQALFAAGPAVLLRIEGNVLAPAPGWPAPAGLAALTPAADFAQSVLSRAAGGASAFWDGDKADQYPVVDAQVARLLGAKTLLCEPLGPEGKPRAILVAGNVPEGMEAQPAWKTFVRALSTRIDALQGAGAHPAASDAIPRQDVRKAVHEASNPLTIIRNYVDLLGTKFAADSETQRDLAIIGGEIERVAGILQGLGAKREETTSGEASPGTWVDVNQVISELVRMSLDTLFLPNKINVQIDLDPGMGSIVTQRDQLKQVLLNLAKNAVEAMPRGGKLGFATARGERDGRACVVIAIQDSGPGLPQQVRERLFQPAASTKSGDHAGLGLYISNNLVEAMGGAIECDSGPGGSLFRIYLPMADMGQNQAALQPGNQKK